MKVLHAHFRWQSAVKMSGKALMMPGDEVILADYLMSCLVYLGLCLVKESRPLCHD